MLTWMGDGGSGDCLSRPVGAEPAIAPGESKQGATGAGRSPSGTTRAVVAPAGFDVATPPGTTERRSQVMEQTAVLLTVVLEEALALWKEIGTGSGPAGPPDPRRQAARAQRAARLLRAAEACHRTETSQLFSNVQPKAAAGPLTPTELRVLSLIAEGLSDQEIACRLYRSRRTVTTHVGSILGKLSVTSRTAAVACAFRNGWV